MSSAKARARWWLLFIVLGILCASIGATAVVALRGAQPLAALPLSVVTLSVLSLFRAILIAWIFTPAERKALAALRRLAPQPPTRLIDKRKRPGGVPSRLRC